MRKWFVALAWGLLSGCSADNPQPVNPSFPVTFSQADRARQEMSVRRARLARPLIIVGGYYDVFNSRARGARDYLRQVVDDEGRMLIVGVDGKGSFPAIRRALIEAVDAAFPTDDPAFTTEVDVLGQSLGGLVARYAAAPADDPAHPRRLRVARMFTVASPHQGSGAAGLFGITRLEHDFSPGSAFVESVARYDAAATYELYPYALLGDWFVGVRNAAPPGLSPFWLASEAWFPHPASQEDPRILADIARRLRGEAPFSRPPAAAVPEGG